MNKNDNQREGGASESLEEAVRFARAIYDRAKSRYQAASAEFHAGRAEYAQVREAMTIQNLAMDAWCNLSVLQRSDPPLAW
jgi:hypothetical protein